MSRQGILEVISSPEFKILEDVVIDEGRNSVGLRVKVKWQHEGIVNNNKRRYPKGLLEREIKRLEPEIPLGKVTGNAFHPPDGQGKPTDVSHKWDKLWMEEDGSCLGEITVLPTLSGSDIITQLRAGVQVGMSSRGFGTVTQKTEEVDGKKIVINEINDDFVLRSPGDFVTRPSVIDAGTWKLLESQMKESDDSTINTKEVKMEKCKDTKELREAYPEFTQEIEVMASAKAKEGMFTEEQKTEHAEAEVKAKLEEVGKTPESLKEAFSETVKKVEEAAHKVGKIEAQRELISHIADEEGVIPEEDPKKTDEGTPAPKVEDNKENDALKKKVTDLEEKNKTLTEEKTTRDKTVAAEKLQEEVKAELNKTLEKDEYISYKSLIEGELVSDDGKISIESVDKVEEAVKQAHGRVSKIITEAQKAAILATGLKPKGEIEDPEGLLAKKAIVEKEKNLYKEARNSGYKGTLAEYKKECLDETE